MHQSFLHNYITDANTHFSQRSFTPESQYTEIDLVIGKSGLFMAKPGTNDILQRIPFTRIVYCGIGPAGTSMSYVDAIN